MTVDRRLAALALAGIAWSLASLPSDAQTRSQQAEKELARKVPAGSVQACSLITRADVKAATGRDPFGEPEAAGQGGWICSVGSVELKLYSGASSWDAWESTLRSFKKDKEPRVPAAGFGERAYFLFLKPDNASRDAAGILVARSGDRTVVLSVDAAPGQPAEATRPALESLMKSVLARLR
jgi:hypothetical protein